jgi:type IV secretory pathway TraG/TraD family ATPase VirD4
MAYALHAVSDLVARYGKEEAKVILSNTSNHILFGRIGHGDREYLEDLSTLVGTWDDIELSYSQDANPFARQRARRTVSRRVVQRPILPVADFHKTPDRQAILVSHLTPWRLDMPRWYEVAWSRRRGWDPAVTPLGRLVDQSMSLEVRP